MTTNATKHTPQAFAQKVKFGRGWLIVRNSGTLANTDYEHVADQIVAALNEAVLHEAVLNECACLSAKNEGLLKALEAAERELHHLSGVVASENQKVVMTWAERARAALAKAKGDA